MVGAPWVAVEAKVMALVAISAPSKRPSMGMSIIVASMGMSIIVGTFPTHEVINRKGLGINLKKEWKKEGRC